MAGELRGTHSSFIDNLIKDWLLKFGDVSPGIIKPRTASQNYITVKTLPQSDWFEIKIAGSGVQTVRFLPQDIHNLPWSEGNIPKKISKSYRVKNHTLNEKTSDEEE
jgi:hypothetical protein